MDNLNDTRVSSHHILDIELSGEKSKDLEIMASILSDLKVSDHSKSRKIALPSLSDP